MGMTWWTSLSAKVGFTLSHLCQVTMMTNACFELCCCTYFKTGGESLRSENEDAFDSLGTVKSTKKSCGLGGPE